ncbi:MAG: endonuclease/exonuclease/phosphatase family protein, partial [bacterium]
MRAVALAYSALVLSWNLARLTPLARLGPFELADTFAWLLFVPLPILVLVVLLRREWRVAAAFLLPSVAFAIEYGPQYAPHRVVRGTALRVATANVYDRNRQPDALADALRRLDADVLAIQELSTPMGKYLAEVLGDRYRFRSLYPHRGSSGLGVFSRLPIRRSTRPELGRDGCRCQVVVLGSIGEAVTIINAHPRPPSRSWGLDASHQEATIDALLQRVRDSTNPVVVAGDLNVADRHYLYRRIRRHLGDAHRDAGWGPGIT